MKKLWAGRFSEGTAKSVEAFTESISFDARLAPYDIKGSQAHAAMLARQGIITKAESAKIIKGLAAIAKEIEAGTFVFRRELEDVHMNIESALTANIGPAGGKLHTGRSRNDQVALDLRLYLRETVDSIDTLLKGLSLALLGQAERHRELIMPGYTHLQRAQPVLLAHHLLAYIEMLERDRERLRDLRKRINVLPLGSGALAGTSLPLDRAFVARELGFDKVGDNSMDGVSDRDFALEFLFASSVIMMHLSRMSEELVLWATEEFSFIEMPDAFATGSSIMPQKKNPDVPELARGKTGRVYGDLMGLLTLMKGLPMAYNRDMQEDKPLVFDAVDTVTGTLGVFTEMMERIRFKEDRLFEAASKGFSTATDVAEYLVRKGMPFRQAHEVTGRLVAYCIKKGKALDELKLDDFRSISEVFEKDVLGCISVKASVASRDIHGATSFRQVGKQLKRTRAKLSK